MGSVTFVSGRTFLIEGLAPLELPRTLARGAPTPRSVRVAHSLRSFGLPRARAPRTPPHARSRGPNTPLRSRGSLAALVRAASGSRPSNSPARSLAGPQHPAPFAWLTRCARSGCLGLAPLELPRTLARG